MARPHRMRCVRRRLKNLRSEVERERIQIAQMTSDRLALLILFFLVFILVLIFRVGENWWPVWAVQHRIQFMGVVILGELALSLSFPLLVEANSNTRTLTGPGHRPSGSGYYPPGG